MSIPTKTFLSFNNDKPWFTGKLKQLRHTKEDAYRSCNKILYNQARNRLTKEIRVAKNTTLKSWKKKLFQANDSATVWTGLEPWPTGHDGASGPCSHMASFFAR